MNTGLMIILPLQIRSFILPIWLILFLGTEYIKDLYLRRIITKHIMSITATAKEIANLNFNVKCQVTSDDEIGTLANYLNKLSSNLEEALNNLECANIQLQKDVQHERVLLQRRKELVDLLSHEMKTSLGLISAYIAGLKIETNKNKREEYMAAILFATERMNDMIVSLITV